MSAVVESVVRPASRPKHEPSKKPAPEPEKRKRPTRLDLAWARLNAELSRFEKSHGKNFPGGDARLESAFQRLLDAIHGQDMARCA